MKTGRSAVGSALVWGTRGRGFKPHRPDSMVKVKCSYCKKIFYKPKGRVNEAKKFGWKQFCSPQCLRLARDKRKSFNCSNPTCKKTFKRSIKEVAASGYTFCSRSCSAIVNNPKSHKRKPKIRICSSCGKRFTGRKKYCSNKCVPKTPIVSKRKIIEEVQEYYKRNGRIPFKKEFYHAKAARLRFGTWNNAIKAAGFEPNPVMFAKKYIANDGHKCDSLAEKIIDDWLLLKEIPHETKVPYNKNRMTADFKVNGTFIEFLGLTGQLKKYDKLVKTKEKLWKERNLKVIKIYPEDLFPKNKLNEIIKF